MSIYERSEDKFEDKIRSEDKHYVNYYTVDSNTIISHLSISKYSKTNSNPKKERVIELEKENSDVEYALFRNEIVKNIAETEAISMSECQNLMKIKINKS